MEGPLRGSPSRILDPPYVDDAAMVAAIGRRLSSAELQKAGKNRAVLQARSLRCGYDVMVACQLPKFSSNAQDRGKRGQSGRFGLA